MKDKKYIIFREKTLISIFWNESEIFKNFDDKENEKIKEGFMPTGRISHNDNMIYQAMIREINSPINDDFLRDGFKSSAKK